MVAMMRVHIASAAGSIPATGMGNLKTLMIICSLLLFVFSFSSPFFNNKKKKKNELDHGVDLSRTRTCNHVYYQLMQDCDSIRFRVVQKLFRNLRFRILSSSECIPNWDHSL